MKSYENKTIIITVTIIFLVIEIIFISLLFIKKEYVYETISGLVIDKNKVIFLLDKEEEKNIYKNTYVYYNNRKVKIEILENHGVVLTNKEKKYKELLLKIKIGNKYKANDSINISIKKNKVKLIKLIKKIWDGDQNG